MVIKKQTMDHNHERALGSFERCLGRGQTSCSTRGPTKLLRLVPVEGNTAQEMFFNGKVSKMQIISLVPLQTISLSTSKLRKAPKDCKEIWKQENRNSLKGI